MTAVLNLEGIIATRTGTWTNAERTQLETVVAALQPSARHLNDILDWIDDISARDQVPPATVLAAPALQTALRSGASAPERLKHWKEQLRRLRYPRLAARTDTVAATIRAMTLGPAITFAPPSDLEGGVVTITIRTRSSAELAAALERLRDRLAHGDVDRLFALLDEA